jgi:GT2 family glycosyltransferase
MEPRISIIIPTWNRNDLALACLDSLRVQTFQAWEAIVVDDGSTDGTADTVKREHLRANVVRLDKNSGFCVAVNAGIERARAEFVLLLNNDMTLEPDFLERLMAAADGSDASLFAPLVLFQDEPELIYGAGDRLLANGRPESVGFRCLRGQFRFPTEIFGVSGGAGLYRREVFDKVGILDERFVAYFEDSDLSFRARLAGFRAEFVEEAVAYHIGSASIANRQWWRARQCYRNHALLVIKNMPAALLLRHGGAILAERVHQFRRVVSSARCEFGLVRALGVALGAWLSVLAAIPHALHERRRIQRTARMESGVLERLIGIEGG